MYENTQKNVFLEESSFGQIFNSTNNNFCFPTLNPTTINASLIFEASYIEGLVYVW